MEDRNFKMGDGYFWNSEIMKALREKKLKINNLHTTYNLRTIQVLC